MPTQQSQTKKRVRIAGGVKDSVPKRVEAGAVVNQNAKTSPIWMANSDLQTVGGKVITVSQNLDAKDTLVKSLEIQLGKERQALLNLTVDWDSAWDVYVSASRGLCLTAEDAKGLGLPAAGAVQHVLAMPLGLTARWDVKHALLRVDVKRAPGLRSVRIEISPDPMTATSFKEIAGDGARAALSGYAPGTWWLRAASVRAREVSAFTTPVAVVVPA